MCAKQVISLIETIKSVFFSRSVCSDDLQVSSRLALDDLHGNLMVNAEVVLQLTFKCVFIDDLHGNRPFLFVKKKFEKTYM